MARKKAKVLLSIVSVLMVCLLAITATTTVAAGDWGNLEAGDEMNWKASPPDNLDQVIEWELEIVSISGADMTYNYKGTVVSGEPAAYSWSGTETDRDFVWFILSQSFLQQAKTAPESKETNFNWQGTNYKAYYLKVSEAWGTDEHWVDQGTGIILETQSTIGGTTYTRVELLSTTADLTEAGGICLGTLLIAFVSVSTVISYSLVRYWKRRNPA